MPSAEQPAESERIATIEKQVQELNGVLEELDILVQPTGSVTKFLKLRGFEQSKAARA